MFYREPPVNRKHIPIYETARHLNLLRTIADEISTTVRVWSWSFNRIQLFKSTGTTASCLVRRQWALCSSHRSRLDYCSFFTTFLRVLVQELPPVTPSDVVRSLSLTLRMPGKIARLCPRMISSSLICLKESIHKNTHGHYEMPLPLKQRPCLPDCKQLAIDKI